MYLYILFTLVESFCIIYSYNDIKNVTNKMKSKNKFSQYQSYSISHTFKSREISNLNLF